MSLRGRFTGSKSSSTTSLYNAPPPVAKPPQPLKKQPPVQTNQAQTPTVQKSSSIPMKQPTQPQSTRPPTQLSSVVPTQSTIQSENPIATQSQRSHSGLTLSTTPPSSLYSPFSSSDPPAIRRAPTSTSSNNNEINSPCTPSGAIVPIGLDQYISSHPLWNYRLNPLNIQTAQSQTSSAKASSNGVHDMFSPISIDPAVKVVLRLRPPNKSEIQQSQGAKVNNSNNLMGFGPTPQQAQDEVFSSLSSNSATATAQHCNQRFNFDLVISPAHHQREVFDNVGKPMLSAFLQGYNTTMFVYGQSGSGKTHTIYGSVPASISESAPVNTPDFEAGMIPRSLHYIYQQLNEASQSVENRANAGDSNPNIPKSFQWKTYCSLLEVYNDRIYDLFEISTTKSSQDAEKNPQTVETANDSECLVLLQDGLKKRKVASTLLNSSSSRSHLVFILFLSTTTTTAAGATIIHNSKLTLIDLAGSERVRKSGVLSEHLGGNSEQLDEATHINTSLTHLSTVISKINANNESNGQKTFVPYRNSALTRLLRDSLGGNSVTCVIACVSPSKIQEQETVGTIRFAQGARKITNAVALNEIKRQEIARGLSDFDKQKLFEYEQIIALNKQQQEKLLGVVHVLLAQRDRFKDILLGAKLVSRGVEECNDGDNQDCDEDDEGDEHDEDDEHVDDNRAEKRLASANDLLQYFASTNLDTLLSTSNDLFDEQGGASEVIQHSEISGMHYEEFLDLFNPNQTQPNASYTVPDPLILFEGTKNVINDIIAQGVQLGGLNETQSNCFLEFQLTKLQQEYSNLQETHGMLIADYKAVCAESEVKSTQIDHLKCDVDNQSKLIAIQQTTITSLEKNLGEAVDESKQHRMVISELQASLSNLQTQLQSLQLDFNIKVTRCEELTTEVATKDNTIQRCEKKINKLVDGIKQVMSHNKVLEGEIVNHQHTIQEHVQTIATQKNTMTSLQELHNKYILDLQETHQALNQQQEELITKLSTQVTQHLTRIQELTAQIEQCETMIESLESNFAKLQSDHSTQSAKLHQTQATAQRLTQNVANLEQALSEAKRESEQLFSINLSLSSHNNDQQKIKMQEILRERLKTAENKLREKELAYDELHQKYYVQFQRHKLINSEIPKPPISSTSISGKDVKEIITSVATGMKDAVPSTVTTITDSKAPQQSPKAPAILEIDLTGTSQSHNVSMSDFNHIDIPSPSHSSMSIPLHSQPSSDNLREIFTPNSTTAQQPAQSFSLSHSSSSSSSHSPNAPGSSSSNPINLITASTPVNLINTPTLSSSQHTTTNPQTYAVPNPHITSLQSTNRLTSLATATQIPQRNIPAKSLKHKQPIGK